MSTVASAIPTFQLDVPIRVDEDGGRRIGKTRVHLETIIWEYWQGQTPEQIVDSYPTLELGVVYAVLAWYLKNQGEVDEYIAERRKAGEELRHKIEKEQGSYADFKAKLMARLAARNPK